MSDYLAFPPARGVRGRVRVPSSKSATNRALVLAALSERSVDVVGALESEDTAALARCLVEMGASIERRGAALTIHGPLGRSLESEILLDAGDSGTAARFLTAIAAAVPGRYRVTGSERLRERPIEELVRALRSLGAEIEPSGVETRLPLAVRGATLRSGRVSVDASRSSQFVSALLLAGATLPEGIEISVTGRIASAPYVRSTVEVLRAFGQEASEEPLRARRGSRSVDRYDVPGDFSSALPLLACAAIAGGRTIVAGVHWPAEDADALAIPVLAEMGLAIESAGGEIRASGGGVRPVRVAATDFPDAVPTLAAVAAHAGGVSRFDGIAHLRHKESDRIESLARLLEAAGARARADADALVVEGPLRPSAVGARVLPTARDHRIAMAAALLALRLPGCLIENPGCVSKSYPAFFRDLDGLCVREPV